MLSIAPASLDFGMVTLGTSKDIAFSVTNTGGGTLTGTASTSAPFSIVSGGSFSLAAGASQAVVIRFSPTTADSFSGNVSLSSNGGNALASISGTGTATTAAPEPAGQPVYPAPPQALEAPTGKQKNLLYLIHGWNSNPKAWAIRMREGIIDYLRGAKVDHAPDASGCETVESADSVWQICTYDWSYDVDLALGLGIDPWKAYVNAMDHGKYLGIRLARQGYDFIHFISHSAGAQLANTAATWIRVGTAKAGIRGPIIHTTFLDAFDPSGEGSFYGQYSEWSEQYLDSRKVGVPLLDDNTDITLRNAFNFDITSLDDESSGITGQHAHAWPYLWYQQTVNDKSQFGYGFALSKVAGGNPIHDSNHQRGHKCVASILDKSCTESEFRETLATVRVVGEELLRAYDLYRATTSLTGAVSLASGVLKMLTDSPVWANLPFNTTEVANLLSFDFAFPRKAEGVLAVFIDGRLIYRADERIDKADEINHAVNVPIGVISKGSHVLTFRLDAYNSTQSEIDISSIRFGRLEIAQTQNQPPTANAGPDQTITAGSIVILNAAASFDPDGGPSPLVFTWNQTEGPGIVLNDATTATPNFRPVLPGTYTFSLVVNDGATTSSPDTVSVVVEDVPILLISPNGGEVWKVKTVQTIAWYRSPTLGNVSANKKLSVQLSRNGGRKWTTLKKVKASVNAVAWKPGSAYRSETARVRVCLPAFKNTSAMCDGSDSDFSIRK